MKKLGNVLKMLLLLALIGGAGVTGYEWWKKPAPYENTEGWKRCYLATYPRSGTNWTRALVQHATGVATGSIYGPEPAARAYTSTVPYEWGGYAPDPGTKGVVRLPQKDDPILIMTHYPITHLKRFDSDERRCVIRIVRNPIDAIYSHAVFKYRYRPEYLPLKPRVWKKFLKQHVKEWRLHIEYWDTQPNVYTFRYEDLMNHTPETLSEILAKLGWDVDSEAVLQACKAAAPKGSIGKHIVEYDEADVKLVKDQLSDLLDRFDYNWILEQELS